MSHTNKNTVCELISERNNHTFAVTHNSFFIMIFENLPAAIHTRSVVLGKNALSRIGQMLENLFPQRSAVIIADKTTWEIAGRKVYEQIESSSAK